MWAQTNGNAKTAKERYYAEQNFIDCVVTMKDSAGK